MNANFDIEYEDIDLSNLSWELEDPTTGWDDIVPDEELYSILYDVEHEQVERERNDLPHEDVEIYANQYDRETQFYEDLIHDEYDVSDDAKALKDYINHNKNPNTVRKTEGVMKKFQ